MNPHMCFRCCGARELSCSHRLCVPQQRLHRVPPGVRQQGRLCRWVRRDGLQWVETRTGPSEQKTTFSRRVFNLFFYPFVLQSTYLTHRVLVTSTWRRRAGRRTVSSSKTLTMTLIGGSAARQRRPEPDLTATTVQVQSKFISLNTDIENQSLF